MTQPNVVHFPSQATRCSECPKAGHCMGFGQEGGHSPASIDISVRPRLLHKQEKLINEGDPLQTLYAVRSGALKVYKTTQTGEEQIIDFCLPGDLIGLDAFFSGYFNCHAAALDTSSVCALDRDDIEQLCATSAAFRKALFQRMSGAIVRSENFVVNLGTRNAYQRLAAFLVELAEHSGRRGYSRVELVLPMSRADIADYLNLAVETISRLFSRLQSAGCVRVKRSAVTVLDFERLYNAAGMTAPPARQPASLH